MSGQAEDYQSDYADAVEQPDDASSSSNKYETPPEVTKAMEILDDLKSDCEAMTRSVVEAMKEVCEEKYLEIRGIKQVRSPKKPQCGASLISCQFDNPVYWFDDPLARSQNR